MTGRVVNLAERLSPSLDGAGAPCRTVERSGAPCTNAARWLLVLDDSSEVRVCRLHANAGERRGALELGASPSPSTTPLSRNR